MLDFVPPELIRDVESAYGPRGAEREPGATSEGGRDQVSPSADDEQQRLRTALDQLAEKQRQIVQLFYYEGASDEEIAARLGTNEHAIRARRSRAIHQLRYLVQANRQGRPAVTDITGALDVARGVILRRQGLLARLSR